MGSNKQYDGGNRLSEKRSLKLGERVSEKLRENPDRIIDQGLTMLDEWEQQGKMSPYRREWRSLLEERDLVSIHDILTTDTDEFHSLRQESPLTPILTRDERDDVIMDLIP